MTRPTWIRRLTAPRPSARHRRRRLTIDSLEDRTTPSAAPYLVADINTGTGNSFFQSSSPSEFTELNGTTYFRAADPNYGWELWKTDGTEAGTVMVKDINPGGNIYNGSGYPSGLTAVNGTLYFAANDGQHGMELWKSDGTAAGTVQIKDIFPGVDSSYLGELTDVNGTVYFSANDGVNGQELWKTDGTEAGTMMVKDVREGPESAHPGSFVAVNGTLYFSASDGTTGFELWKTDGTVDGTVLVKDIRPGSNSSYPGWQTIVGETLYFSANDGSTGNELWKSDGTEAGTVQVKDIRSGTNSSSPGSLTNLNGILVFRANDGTAGEEVWKSDGTAAGTVLIKDIRAGANSSGPDELTVANGTLYFRAIDVASGQELWKTDGTSAGTLLIKDIRAGANSSGPYGLTAVGDTLHFIASDGTTGSELWKSDGTVDGTVLVKDINPGPSPAYASYLGAANGKLFLSADDGINGQELWVSDGTEAGTALLKDIARSTDPSYPDQMTVAGGKVYFSAFDETNGRELWVSDGTAGGTALVKDVRPGPNASYPRHIAAAGGIVYFAAHDGTTGHELWKTDGTEAGTAMVKDIRPGSGSAIGYSYGSVTADLNGILFFAANDGNGRALWTTDGTEAGTTPFQVAGESLTDPRNMVVINSTLFFTVGDGSQLWKTDGTEAGTVLVKELSVDSYAPMAVANGNLYFSANDGLTGQELWKSDGTEAGTVLVKDVRPGAGPAYPFHLTAMGDAVYFAANDGTVDGLWKTDGTEAGTVKVKDLMLSWYSSPVPVDGTLYLIADDGNSGQELWKSDGTEDGTILVKDIETGSYYGEPLFLTAVAGQLFFLANNSQALWTSDGSEEGTVTVSAAGAGLSFEFSRLLALDGRLMFSAGDMAHGFELWALDVDVSQPPTVTVNSGSVAGAEAVAAANAGTFGDADTGDTVTVTADVGTITTAGNVWTWNYTPADDEAPRTVTVTATDAGGLNATTTFTFSAANQNPSAVNDALLVIEDGGQNIDVLANDTDPAGAADPLTVTGHTAPVNGSVSLAGGTFTYTPAPNYNGTDSFTYTVSDGDGGTATGTVTVNVSPANDRPVLGTVGTPMLLPTKVLSKLPPIDSPVGLLTGNATEVDGGSVGLAIVGADTGNGKWEYNLNVTAAGGGTWATFPTVTPSAGLLLADDGNTRIRFVPKAKFQGFAGLTFAAWDQTGPAGEGTTADTAAGTAFSSTTDRAWIAVGKTKPTVDTNGATVLKAVKEDSKASRPVLVKDLIGIAGLESSGIVNPGIAVIGTGTDGTWEYQIAKTKEWKLIGPASAAAARLLGPADKVRFTPAFNAEGGGTLTFHVWDNTGGTAGNTLPVSGASFGKDPGAAVIDITPLADAPIMDLSKAAVLNPVVTVPGVSNAATIGSLMSATDAEGATLGVAVTVAKGAGWEIRRAGDANFSPLPKLTGGKALLLAANTEVQYRAAAGEAGTPTLSFKAWDSTGASAVPVKVRGVMVSKETEVLTVAVGNTAPVLDINGSPALPAIKVGAKPGRGATVKSILGPVTDTAKSPVGIAVVGVDNTNGTWQFSLGGNKWVDFGAISPGSAVLLTDAHRIRFVPNATAAGKSPEIQFKAWDQSAGKAGDRIDTTGALNSFSTAVEIATVSVTA